MFNLKSLLTLTLGIIIGISCMNLFKGCGSSTEVPIISSTTKASVAEKENALKEKQLQVKFDSISKRESKLKQELSSTKSTLAKLKTKNTRLQTQVYDLLDAKTFPDSAQTDYCDSLKTKVIELMNNSNQKDSLQDSVSVNLEEQLQLKDLTISLQNLKYQELKTSFQKSLTDLSSLENENKFLKNKFKRQKIKSRLASAAILIISGAAAGLLLTN
jgi:hypothetical protein